MNLLIENLAPAVTESDLCGLFDELDGFETSFVWLDKSGISRGCGFAQFETHLEGRQVISNFNGHKMKGKRIKITQTRAIPLPHTYAEIPVMGAA